MRKALTIGILIVVVFGGLLMASKMRAPKPAPPSTQEIWHDEGIPVRTSVALLGDMEQVIEVTGDINALSKVTLSPKVQGRVAAVYAREGDSVSQGQTVVLLDQEDALSNVQQADAALESANARLSQARTNAKVTRIQTDTAIEQAQASLNAAKARLAVVKKPTRSQERMVAENNVASAKANLDNAEANFRRYQQLLKEGAISEATFDTYETQQEIARASYRSAQEQLSLIREGGRPEDVLAAQSQVDVAQEQLRSAKANSAQNMLRLEDIKSAEASVRQSRAAVALARQQLSYTYVKSPISGQLASRLTEPGQVVAPGQSVGAVVNLSSLYFKGEVSETELSEVRRGQVVRVSVDAIPGRVFDGTLDEIYPSASVESRSFPVRVRILNSGGAIRPGMFARGGIVVSIDRNVLLVPKDAVEERRGAAMVFTIATKRVPVEEKPEPGKPATEGAKKAPKTRVATVAVRHDITVVRGNPDHVQVGLPTDLRPGDVVVTRGRQNVNDGSVLNVER